MIQKVKSVVPLVVNEEVRLRTGGGAADGEKRVKSYRPVMTEEEDKLRKRKRMAMAAASQSQELGSSNAGANQKNCIVF